MTESEKELKKNIYKYVFFRKIQTKGEKKEKYSYKDIFLPKEYFDLAEKSVRESKEKKFCLLFFLLNAVYPIVTILIYLYNGGKTSSFMDRIFITLPILNLVLLLAVTAVIYISVSEFIYKIYLEKEVNQKNTIK